MNITCFCFSFRNYIRFKKRFHFHFIFGIINKKEVKWCIGFVHISFISLNTKWLEFYQRLRLFTNKGGKQWTSYCGFTHWLQESPWYFFQFRQLFLCWVCYGVLTCWKMNRLRRSKISVFGGKAISNCFWFAVSRCWCCPWIRSGKFGNFSFAFYYIRRRFLQWRKINLSIFSCSLSRFCILSLQCPFFLAVGRNGNGSLQSALLSWFGYVMICRKIPAPTACMSSIPAGIPIHIVPIAEKNWRSSLCRRDKGGGQRGLKIIF